MDENEKYWREEVKKSTRGELETVRKAAVGWSTLFAAALGIYGTVTFAGGLTGLDDLDETYRPLVIGATIVAAGFALAATILAGLAAGPSASKSDSEAWQDFENSNRTMASTAFLQLRLAKIGGLIAAATVLVGATFTLVVGPAEEAPKVQRVLVVAGDTVVCGPLTRSESGLAVEGLPLKNRPINQVQVVDSCP